MAKSIRFICDAMLGRLADHLIHAGYDCRYDNTINDERLVRLAVDEDRVILTRDRDLILSRFPDQKRLFLLDSGSLGENLKRLTRAFQLYFSREDFFTRCTSCNRRLKTVELSEIQDEIPKDTRQWIDDYYRCPGCEEIYWKGSHYRDVIKKFKRWRLLESE
jgi:uncharacterized protein with PIN domain